MASAHDEVDDARRIRRIHRTSVAAGVVVVALALAATVASPQPCGDLSSRYPPIVAFELARSPADLRAVFGSGRGRAARCRQTVVAGMDTMNRLDLALFIPAYGTFLIAAFVGLGRRRRPAARAGVGLVVIAVAADVVADVCMLGLTPALDAGARELAVLPWAAGAKWLALGAASVVAGVARWRGAGGRLSAALCALSAAATVAAIVDPHRFGPLVASGLAASWAVLLLDGAVEARARLPARPPG